MNSRFGRTKQVSDSAVVVLGVLVILGAGWAAHALDPRFLELDFWQLLFANAVGVLGGGYLALWSNRRVTTQQESRRREIDAQKERERAIQALGGLRKAVLHNQEQVEDLLHALDRDRNSAVFSTADPDALDPILSRLVETIDDLMLIRSTSDFRHRLAEFSQMAQAQLDLYLLPENHPKMKMAASTDSAADRVRRIRNRVLDKIQRFGQRVSTQAEELLEEVNEVQDRIEKQG